LRPANRAAIRTNRGECSARSNAGVTRPSSGIPCRQSFPCARETTAVALACRAE
jgi:hypothetical protein